MSALATGVAVNASSSAYGRIPANSASNISGGGSGGVSSIKNVRGSAGDDTAVDTLTAASGGIGISRSCPAPART